MRARDLRRPTLEVRVATTSELRHGTPSERARSALDEHD
jgi:hypothetical protein